MPTLTYTGQRRIRAENATDAVPTLATKLVQGIHADNISVGYGRIEPGANGEIKAEINVSIDGTYSELATAESELATQIVNLEFEPDVETAAEKLSLE